MNSQRKILLVVFILSFFSVGLSWAGNGLWTDGKDRPKERVNVGVKSLTPDAYMKVSEKVDAAVVNISTTKVIKGGRNWGGLFHGQRPNHPNPQPKQKGPSPFDNFFGDDFFEKFFGAPQGAPNQDLRQQSLGSGFILNSEGYIATNNHVVERADEIRVVLSDESEHIAKVIGRDPKTDVALVKIDTKKKLTSVVLGDSDALKVGEVVVAIGNPFGLSHSLTQGIVSAKERSIGFGSYDDFIQTDASINPGNSGGPLLNLYGEVIGINTAIVSSGQGIGFAIPINLAKAILLKLKQEGRVIRGWLGVYIQQVTEEHAKALKLKDRLGALVSQVQVKSPAEKAGLKAGDVITRFDGKGVKDWRDLPLAVANTTVGKKTEVEVVRDGKRKKLRVSVGELPADEGEKPSEVEEKTDQLGLRIQKITPEIARSLKIDEKTEGVVTTEVDPKSAAYEKGLRRGDVILEVNRTKTATVSAYRSATKKLKKGNTVLLLVKRGDGTLFIAFTLP